MLDETIELAAAGGAHQVVMGMAHRGRLNALVHTVGRAYESILREFEGERSLDALVVDPEGGTGDVKYHLPATGTRGPPRARSRWRSSRTRATSRPSIRSSKGVRGPSRPTAPAGRTARPDGLAPGPDPRRRVVCRARGSSRRRSTCRASTATRTGGTLHLIANNQVGFTTDPMESRSTRYSSDLAKGFDVPIVHVNADDPEAALSAVRLALAYRTEFGHDFVIDLIGYRRFGHNEQDEASYTQPLMVERIAQQPTVRERYAARLVEEGVIAAGEEKAMAEAVTQTLREAHERLRKVIDDSSLPRRDRSPSRPRPQAPVTRSGRRSRQSASAR